MQGTTAASATTWMQWRSLPAVECEADKTFSVPVILTTSPSVLLHRFCTGKDYFSRSSSSSSVSSPADQWGDKDEREQPIRLQM